MKFTILGLLSLAFAFNALATVKLTPMEHERLRFRLENLFNEVDLLVQNQGSDRSDLNRMDREFQMFHVLDRIPLERKSKTLVEELAQTAKARGLIVKSIRVTGYSKSAKKIPKEIYTDVKPAFKLTDDQIAEAIRFEGTVDGKEADMKAWIANWKQDQVRFAELSGEPKKKGTAKETEWRVNGQAYRFRDEGYPRLHPRDPMELLPAWARKNPKAFAESEPILWSFVTRTRALIPRTPAAYEKRQRFMLATERFEFFMRKTEGKPKQP